MNCLALGTFFPDWIVCPVRVLPNKSVLMRIDTHVDLLKLESASRGDYIFSYKLGIWWNFGKLAAILLITITSWDSTEIWSSIEYIFIFPIPIIGVGVEIIPFKTILDGK